RQARDGVLRHTLAPMVSASNREGVARRQQRLAQTLLLLPGDGIGTEIMAEVEKLVALLNEQQLADFRIERGLVGGSAYDAHGEAISEEDMERALGADAV